MVDYSETSKLKELYEAGQDGNQYSEVASSDISNVESTVNDGGIMESQVVKTTMEIRGTLIQGLMSSLHSAESSYKFTMETTFLDVVLNIIRKAIGIHKWYNEKMGMLNCKLCKYFATEPTEFIDHLACKVHLENMTLQKDLFEKKVLLFSIVDNLELCRAQINSLNVVNISGDFNENFGLKRKLLSALREAILFIRSEEEKVNYSSTEQTQQSSNFSTSNYAKYLFALDGKVSKVNKEEFVTELLEILNEYRWYRRDASQGTLHFRCLLCKRNTLKFHKFLFHISNPIHLGKVYEGNNNCVKMKLLLEMLMALRNCEFRIVNLDMDTAIVSQLCNFKRNVEVSLKAAKENILYDLKKFEKLEQDIREVVEVTKDCQRSGDSFNNEGSEKVDQNPAIGTCVYEPISEDKIDEVTEKVSSIWSLAGRDILERLNSQTDQNNCQSYEDTTSTDKSEKEILEILVKHNLWPETVDGTWECHVCKVDVHSVLDKLAHAVGAQHLRRMLFGITPSVKMKICEELLNIISNCENDLEAIKTDYGSVVKAFLTTAKFDLNDFVNNSETQIVSDQNNEMQISRDDYFVFETIQRCLEPFGSFECNFNQYQCVVCKTFSSSSFYSFIEHTTDVTHLDNIWDGLDEFEKFDALSGFHSRLEECTHKVEDIYFINLSMKNNILFCLNEAKLALEARKRQLSFQNRTRENSNINNTNQGLNPKENAKLDGESYYNYQSVDAQVHTSIDDNNTNQGLNLSESVGVKCDIVTDHESYCNYQSIDVQVHTCIDDNNTNQGLILNESVECEVVTDNESFCNYQPIGAKAQTRCLKHKMEGCHEENITGKVIIKDSIDEESFVTCYENSNASVNRKEVIENSENRNLYLGEIDQNSELSFSELTFTAERRILKCHDGRSENVVNSGGTSSSYDIPTQSNCHQVAVSELSQKSNRYHAQIETEYSFQPKPVDMTNDLIIEILAKHNLLPGETGGSFCCVCKTEVHDAVGTRLSHVLGYDHLTCLLNGKRGSDKKQMCIDFYYTISNCEADLQKIKPNGYTKIDIFLDMLNRAKCKLLEKLNEVDEEIKMERRLVFEPPKVNVDAVGETILKYLIACGLSFVSDQYNCNFCRNAVFFKPEDCVLHLCEQPHINQICVGLNVEEKKTAFQNLQSTLEDFALNMRTVTTNKVSLKHKMLLALNVAKNSLRTRVPPAENILDSGNCINYNNATSTGIEGQICPVLNSENCNNYNNATTGIEGQICTILDLGNCSNYTNATTDIEGQICTIETENVYPTKESLNDPFNTMDDVDDCGLLSVIKAVNSPIILFYSCNGTENTYFCQDCDLEFTIPVICPNLVILQHLISFEHLSMCKTMGLSLKIKLIEEFFADLEGLKPNVIKYLKRSNFYDRMCEVVRKTKKEIVFVKTFETDFWNFASKLKKTVPVCDYFLDHDAVKLLQIICHQSYVDQFKDIDDVKVLHFNFFKLHKYLVGFPAVVFNKEVQAMILYFSVGIQAILQKLEKCPM